MLGVLVSGLAATDALATIEYNKAISHVGSQGNNLAYISFTVPPGGSCAYDNVYFDITTDKGKSFYATFLSAYLAGRKISRLDYTNTGGACFVDLV